jgi:hypothetical protein
MPVPSDPAKKFHDEERSVDVGGVVNPMENWTLGVPPVPLELNCRVIVKAFAG